MRPRILVFAAFALVTATGLSLAQGPGGIGGVGGDRLMLLSQDSVRSELKITDQQRTAIEELSTKRRESMQELRELSGDERRAKWEERAKATREALAKILNEEQAKRLQQIGWQQQGSYALADVEVADALALTDEQKSQVSAALEAGRAAMRALREEGDREQAREKFRAARDETRKKLDAVLTADQQAKWQELQGAKFEGEIRFERRGRNRRAE